MSKCFVSFDCSLLSLAAYAEKARAWIDEEAKVPSLGDGVALVAKYWRAQRAAHITLQYCGKEITDEDVKVLKTLWRKAFDNWRDAASEEPLAFRTQPRLSVFGKASTALVVHSKAPAWLLTLVEETRARVREALPHVPPSDYPFQAPHFTFATIDVDAMSDEERARFDEFGVDVLQTMCDELTRKHTAALRAASQTAVCERVTLFGPADAETGAYTVRDSFSVLGDDDDEENANKKQKK